MINSQIPALPAKSSFKFQELPLLTDVKPYVLRFWETEFPEISPVTSEGGEKIYSRTDVETIFKVRKLLFEHKLNIEQAKGLLSHPEEVEAILNQEAQKKKRSKKISLTDSPQVRIKRALSIIDKIKLKNHW